MHHEYKTQYTCSRSISFDLDGEVVHNVHFNGGCPGNVKAVASLVEGMTVDEIAARCEGITCGPKPTSCSDQLVRAIKAAREEERVMKA